MTTAIIYVINNYVTNNINNSITTNNINNSIVKNIQKPTNELEIRKAHAEDWINKNPINYYSSQSSLAYYTEYKKFIKEIKKEQPIRDCQFGEIMVSKGYNKIRSKKIREWEKR